MMEMIPGDAEFIFWTELWHLSALIFSLFINGIMVRKAENTPQRTFYILVQSCALLWIFSKMLKTVAPDINLRWIFIVSQYLGISFLGTCFFLFSYYTVQKKLPAKWVFYVLGILSSTCFLLMATNPLHHLFYRTYDFYNDQFGPLFYLTMVFQYSLMLLSLMMISKKVIIEKESSRAERFIGMAALIPFTVNILYTAGVIQPLFDITPIAMTMVLSLFALAAFKYRFLGTINLADDRIRQGVHDPILILDPQGSAIALAEKDIRILNASPARKVKQGETIEVEGHYYRLQLKEKKRRYLLEHWIDVSPLRKLEGEHQEACNRLESLSRQIMEGQRQELERARMEAVKKIQYNLHDILGHSMTQIILLLHSAMARGSSSEIKQRNAYNASRICRLCLEDISTSNQWEKERPRELLSTGLFKIKEDFVNVELEVCITLRGNEIPIDKELHRNLLFCCKEALTNAIRHGGASSVNIMLRFLPESLNLLIADDGSGSSAIIPGMGLKGMTQRLEHAGGQLRCQSAPGEGTLLVLSLPLSYRRESLAITQ